jgi:multidrug efflux pump subunit AcrB
MKSLVGWFAANPVAANLLMLLIVLGGIASLGQIEQEVFPRLNLNRILVTAEYPGASPVEVEQAVCIPIENALHDLEGVHRLDTAIEGDNCTVKALVRAGYALEGVMNAVRARTQSLPRLPRAVEPIRVKEDRGDSDDGVIWVALYGPTDTLSLKRLGERIRLDLARLPGVEQALDYGDLRDEIAIQVSAVKLQQYGLTLTDVAEAVRRASVDLPGGAIKAPAGELVVRVEGQARHADSFADLILTTRADGMRVRLGEIATIIDGLQKRWFEWHHDGEPGVGWEIHAKRNTVAVARGQAVCRGASAAAARGDSARHLVGRFRPICLVMILTLVFSLIEALLIPARPAGCRSCTWGGEIQLLAALAGGPERRTRGVR